MAKPRDMQTAQHMTELDAVASKAQEIADFVAQHPEVERLFALAQEYRDLKDQASKAIKVVRQTTGQTNFVSEGELIGGKVDVRQDIDGDKLIREHGETLLEKAPRSLKVVKSELYKVDFTDVKIDDYLESPVFVAQVAPKDRMIKALIHKLEDLMDAIGADRPENPDDLESWYAVYDGLKRASN